jgi:hypothetical protein
MKASNIWDYGFLITTLIVVIFSNLLNVQLNKINIPGNKQLIRNYNEFLKSYNLIVLVGFIIYKLTMKYGCDTHKDDVGYKYGDVSFSIGRKTLTYLLRFITLILTILNIALLSAMINSNEFQYVKNTSAETYIILTLVILLISLILVGGSSSYMWYKNRNRSV